MQCSMRGWLYNNIIIIIQYHHQILAIKKLYSKFQHFSERDFAKKCALNVLNPHALIVGDRFSKGYYISLNKTKQSK